MTYSSLSLCQCIKVLNCFVRIFNICFARFAGSSCSKKGLVNVQISTKSNQYGEDDNRLMVDVYFTRSRNTYSCQYNQRAFHQLVKDIVATVVMVQD